MKKDKLYILMTICQWLFFAGVPIALFIMKCTTIAQTKDGTGFIITASGYIFLLIIYIIVKKTILKNYINDLQGKIVNYTTQITTETDQEKIPLVEKALSKCLIMRHIINILPVILVFGLLMVFTKALEQSLVNLYSVLGVCFLSFILGLICVIIQSKYIKSKHRS